MFWEWFLWQWEVALTCYDNLITQHFVDVALHERNHRILWRVSSRKLFVEGY